MKTGNYIQVKKTSVAAFAAVLILIFAPWVQSAPLKSKVEMVVTFGGKDLTLILELDEVNAPKTSQNFRKLCSSGFYDGVLFHRVIPGYIVQAGDPLSKEPAKRLMWGTGGPGYTVPAELGQPHLKGSLAAARLGDGVNAEKESSGSQFYVSLDKIPSLDGEYTVFGSVLSGLDELVAIGNAATDENNVPNDPITIKSTKVIDDNLAPKPVPTEITKIEELMPEPEPVAIADTPPSPEPVPDSFPTPVESQPETAGISDITPIRDEPTKPSGVPAVASEAVATGEAPSWTKDKPATGNTGEPATKPKKAAGPVTKFLKRFW